MPYTMECVPALQTTNDRLDDIQTDVGCCILQPMRVTPFAALLYADSTATSTTKIEGKLFGAHVINVTLRGCWQFHGRRGRHVIDPATAMLGRMGDTYGCGHRPDHPETNLIAALRSTALDPDEGPIFGRDTLRGTDLHRIVQLAAACNDDERFESMIFEAFELASKHSLVDRRRGSRLRMQRLKRFIEQHCSDAIGLEEMAQVTGLSSFACVRQFKEATGKTPYAYLLECRIARARLLLGAHRISIAQAGFTSGFPDQAYFSRIFKHATGMTPMQYRRCVTGTQPLEKIDQFALRTRAELAVL